MHDAGTGLHRCDPAGDNAGADRDRQIHARIAGADEADGAGIGPAALGFELVDDLHRPHFRRPGHRPGGEHRPERVERARAIGQFAVHLTHDVKHMRVALDGHEIGDPHRPVARETAHVIAAQIDQHDMLGALLLVRQQFGGERRIFFRRLAAWTCAGDGTYGEMAVGHAHQQLG